VGLHAAPNSRFLSSAQHLNSEDQKRLMSTFTDTFPIRFQHIYVLHQPWCVHALHCCDH